MPSEVNKFYDGEGSVTWGVVMMEYPFVCNVLSHANNAINKAMSLSSL